MLAKQLHLCPLNNNKCEKNRVKIPGLILAVTKRTKSYLLHLCFGWLPAIGHIQILFLQVPMAVLVLSLAPALRAVQILPPGNGSCPDCSYKIVLPGAGMHLHNFIV